MYSSFICVEDLNFLRRAAKELDGAAAEKLRLDAFVAEVREGNKPS